MGQDLARSGVGKNLDEEDGEGREGDGEEERKWEPEDGREEEVGIKHTDVLTCHSVKHMNMTVKCAWHMLEDVRLKNGGTRGVRGATMEEKLPICLGGFGAIMVCKLVRYSLVAPIFRRRAEGFSESSTFRNFTASNRTCCSFAGTGSASVLRPSRRTVPGAAAGSALPGRVAANTPPG